MKRLLEVEKEINYLVHGNRKSRFGAPGDEGPRRQTRTKPNEPCTDDSKAGLYVSFKKCADEIARVLKLIEDYETENAIVKLRFYKSYSEQYNKILSNFELGETPTVNRCNEIKRNMDKFIGEISNIDKRSIDRLYKQKLDIYVKEQEIKNEENLYFDAVKNQTIRATRDIYELTKSSDSVIDQLRRYICYLQVFVIDPIHDGFKKKDDDPIKLIRQAYITNIIEVINNLRINGLLIGVNEIKNANDLNEFIYTLFPQHSQTNPDPEDLDKNGNPKQKPSHADGYVTLIFKDKLGSSSDKLELIMINILEILFGDKTVEALFPIATPTYGNNKSMYRILQGNQSETPTFSEDNNQNLLIVTDVYPTNVSKTLALQTFFKQYNQNPTRYPFKIAHVDTIANDHDEGTFESWQLNLVERLEVFDISAGHLFVDEFFTFRDKNGNSYKAPISDYSITRDKHGTETKLNIKHVFGDSGISGTFTEAKVEEIKKEIQGTDKNKVATVLSKFFCDKAIRDTAQELPKNDEIIKDYGEDCLVMFLSNDGICSSAAAQTLPGAIFNLSILVDELAQGSEHIAVRPGSTLQQWLNRHPERPTASAGATNSQGAVAGAQDSQQTEQQEGTVYHTALTQDSPSKSDVSVTTPAPVVQNGTPQSNRVRRRPKKSYKLPSLRRLFRESPKTPVSTDTEGSEQEFDLMNQGFGKRFLQKKIHELEKEIKYLGKNNER